MKKLISLFLVLCCFIVLASPAFADAKMTITQKKFITFENNWQGYFFAKVENTGDSAGYLEYGGKLVGFDADDNIILSKEYVGSYPSRVCLEPGEYAYIKDYFLEKELETNTVTDYKFSIKAESQGIDYKKLPSEAVLSYKGGNSYDNYVYVTFTNTTTDILYGFAITVAMFDQNGDLIFVNGDSTSSIGIHPGSTVTIKTYIDGDLVKYFTQNSLTPTTVESLVYISK